MNRRDAVLLQAIEGINARIDGVNERIDRVNTRLDTVIDAVAELRADFATHRHDDDG